MRVHTCFCMYWGGDAGYMAMLAQIGIFWTFSFCFLQHSRTPLPQPCLWHLLHRLSPVLLGMCIYANAWAQSLFFSWCTSVSFHGSNGLRCVWQHLKYGILWFSQPFSVPENVVGAFVESYYSQRFPRGKNGKLQTKMLKVATTFLLQVLSPTSL